MMRVLIGHSRVVLVVRTKRQLRAKFGGSFFKNGNREGGTDEQRWHKASTSKAYEIHACLYRRLKWHRVFPKRVVEGLESHEQTQFGLDQLKIGVIGAASQFRNSRADTQTSDGESRVRRDCHFFREMQRIAPRFAMSLPSPINLTSSIAPFIFTPKTTQSS